MTDPVPINSFAERLTIIENAIAEALKGGGGGGKSGGMEARVAVLEADLKHVKGQLDRLENVPADIATLTERSTHLATKADVVELGNTIGAKVQRNMYIIGALVAVLTLVLKFIQV